MSFDESGHWYRRDGSPCYEVPAKSKGPGGMRGVDLRWDRHLALVPSVTTVSSVRAKPALINYFVEQAILAALTMPRRDGETEAQYIARIKADGKAAAKAAAEEGSRIHDAIESWFKNGFMIAPTADNKYLLYVEAVSREITRLFPDVRDWISEKSFAHPLGYGGKVDLHSPSTGIVVDFKTKDGDFTELDAYGKPKKLAWDQHIQLAAYQVGLGLSYPFQTFSGEFVKCANIFVSRTHPGAVTSHVWSADEIAAGWRQFECELALWKCVHNYNGAY